MNALILLVINIRPGNEAARCLESYQLIAMQKLYLSSALLIQAKVEFALQFYKKSTFIANFKRF